MAAGAKGKAEVAAAKRRAGSRVARGIAADSAVRQSAAKASGTQAIHRAMQLLGLVAEHGFDGIRLSEMADHTGLHVATAHRLLSALLREGMVAYDPYSRRYQLGMRLLDLGEAARSGGLGKALRGVVQKVAAAAGDIVYLYLPTGFDLVCVERIGRRPSVTPVLIRDIGDRLPIGVGAGGLALLALLPDARVAEILSANRLRYANYSGLGSAEVRKLVELARRRGYGLNDQRVVAGMSAVGVAARNAAGVPIAAITLVTSSDRLPPRRQKWAAGLIADELKAVGLG